MSNWNLYAQIAQVISVPVTTLGIMTSLYIGIRTLRELRNERELHVQPHLLFDGGGHRFPASLRDSNGIPGINYQFAQRLTKGRPPGSNQLHLDAMFSNLRNHGQGPALDVSITFIPYRIFMGVECFIVDDKKRDELPYSESLNTISSMPDHISPGAYGSFARLPTPLVIDYGRRISRFDFIVKIFCKDLFSHKHTTYQGLRIMIDPSESPKYVHFVFLEEINPREPDFSIFGSPDSSPINFTR